MLLRALIVGLTMVTLSPAAWALDEGQWQVGVAAEAAAGFDDGVFPGGGGRLDGRYGITDALSAGVAVGSVWWSRHGHTTRVSSASGGLTLAFDVLRTVPFVSLGVAAADVGGDLSLGGELNAGAEYLLDPKWSLGLIGRLQWFPLRLTGDARVGLVTLGLRLARTF
jgi:hypothetical protein